MQMYMFLSVFASNALIIPHLCQNRLLLKITKMKLCWWFLTHSLPAIWIPSSIKMPAIKRDHSPFFHDFSEKI